MSPALFVVVVGLAITINIKLIGQQPMEVARILDRNFACGCLTLAGTGCPLPRLYGPSVHIWLQVSDSSSAPLF